MVRELKNWLCSIKENEIEKRKCISNQIDDIRHLFEINAHHRIGNTALELVQFCESLTELEYTRRMIEIIIKDNE